MNKVSCPNNLKFQANSDFDTIKNQTLDIMMPEVQKDPIRNAMTIDVEDYFQVAAFENRIERKNWVSYPLRVENNVIRLLDLFQKYNTKATFFTLGWVAERCPQTIKKIVADGHELASHGYDHTRITQQTPEQFRADIKKAKLILEEISGQEVLGYRAPTYSITEKTLWAHKILEDEGHRYSSSVYPVKHDLYGIPDAPRFKYQPENVSQLIEIPVSTFNFLGKNMPCGGGGFFRLYPYIISAMAMRHINIDEKQPGIFYFHPWEIDPDQPKQPGLSYKSEFRHYLNLNCMENRIEQLLNDFNWDTMQAIFL